ncbi:MAG: polysaccharide pyruvyl transferase family protein [Chromatiales bacterium]|jgi:hypothetical protein|nr:polysaccharide pyruvyl transferase family protein [Chromatiales bacterium]
MKIALFNDTAAYGHFGCHAVSDAHARMLGRAGHEVKERFFLDWSPVVTDPRGPGAINHLLHDDDFRHRIENVDAVIVNGEGTIHHGSGLHLLAVLGAAQKLGKATLLVNAVYENSEFHEDVIARLDDFTVREQSSLEYAKSRKLPARLVLDSSYAASFSDDRLIDLSEKVVLTDWHLQRTADVGKTIRDYLAERREHAFFLPFERSDAIKIWHRIPASLSSATVVHTARHHGVYFCIKAKIPFVALPSNTHKVEGLLKQYGPKIPIVKSLNDLKEGEKWAMANKNYYEDFFHKIEECLPLDTFRCLGEKFDPQGEQREITKLALDLSHHSSSPMMNGEFETKILSTKYIDMVSSVKNSDTADITSEDAFSQMRNELDALRSELGKLYDSRSWRLTAPYRFLGRFAHSLFGRMQSQP